MKRLTALTAVLAMLLVACTSQTVIDTTTTRAGDRPIIASAFQTFDTCDELLAYYQSHALDIVGPYGLGGFGPVMLAVEEMAADATTAAPAAAGSTRDFTETNVQVAGVDEADIVKTDGDRIFTITDGSLRVALVTDTSAVMAGRLTLDWAPQAMLLEGNTLLLVGGTWGRPVPLGGVTADIAPEWSSPVTRIVQVDVSDPNTPSVVRTLDFDGTYLDAREVDGIARIAVNSYPVGLSWTYPQGSGIRAEREAIEANRDIIRSSTLDNWLPYFVLTEAGGGEREGRLLDCRSVMAPSTFSGIDTLSLLTFDMHSGIESWSNAGVVASGATMYATADSVYLATQQWMNWQVFSEAEARDAAVGFRSQIHKFDTSSPAAPRYVASGEVPGFLLNQFAMDEYQGNLRVASTTSPEGWWWSNDSESRVTVLGESGDRLVELGSVGGLGKTERIYSVRFMGDLGYVVTFRQTDPLYVIDLSRPTAPVAVGELKIPGYSAYLHPVGEGRLLGLGQDADENGRVKGTQLSLFDVTNPANPTRLDQVSLPGGWSQAESDHHAFTFVDGLALAPYESWGWEVAPNGGEISKFDSGVLAVRVSGDTLSLDGILRPALDDVVATTPTEIDRIQPWRYVPMRTIVIDGRIYTITSGGIAVHDGTLLERIEFIEF